MVTRFRIYAFSIYAEIRKNATHLYHDRLEPQAEDISQTIINKTWAEYYFRLA